MTARDDLPMPLPRPRRARLRAAATLVGLAAVPLLGLGACSDDDGATTTTTTTSTTEASAPSTTEVEGETTTTTAPGSGRPLNESDLVDALLPPEEVADGLTVAEDDLGAGDFQPNLCPEVEVEVTWEDQAAQRLVRTGEAGTLAVAQAVLAFADDVAAEAFVDDALEAFVTCDPGVVTEDVADSGDRAVRIVGQGDPPVAAGAVVRAGAHVAFLQVMGAPPADPAAVVTPELVRAAAARLP